jgi:fusion and transport protein UGO1
MDYSDYLSSSSPSAKDVVRQLAEQAVWKYTSVFLAQPFEVAKTVLQVHVAGSDPRFSTQAQVAERTRRRPEAYRDRDRDGQYDVRRFASSQCAAANVIT